MQDPIYIVSCPKIQGILWLSESLGILSYLCPDQPPDQQDSIVFSDLLLCCCFFLCGDSLGRRMRKPAFCINETRGCKSEADEHFRFIFKPQTSIYSFAGQL